MFLWKMVGYILLICISLVPSAYAAEIVTPVSESKIGQVLHKADVKFVSENEQNLDVLTEYRLNKFDVINVAISGSDESNFKDVVVGPDGYVNLPYVGAVKIGGLTVPLATAVLKEKLGEYIRVPNMTIMVMKYSSRKVYVLGAVEKPGVQTLGWDNMNLIAALSSAGGIGAKGRPKHVNIVRQVDGKVYRQEVDFDRLVEKADLTQNVALQDGDLVYVPKSNKIDLNQDVMPVVTTWLLLKSL